MIYRILEFEGTFKIMNFDDRQTWLPIQMTWGVYNNVDSQAPSRPTESDSQGIWCQCQKHWSKLLISQMRKLGATNLSRVILSDYGNNTFCFLKHKLLSLVYYPKKCQ